MMFSRLSRRRQLDSAILPTSYWVSMLLSARSFSDCSPVLNIIRVNVYDVIQLCTLRKEVVTTEILPVCVRLRAVSNERGNYHGNVVVVGRFRSNAYGIERRRELLRECRSGYLIVYSIAYRIERLINSVLHDESLSERRRRLVIPTRSRQ